MVKRQNNHHLATGALDLNKKKSYKVNDSKNSKKLMKIIQNKINQKTSINSLTKQKAVFPKFKEHNKPAELYRADLISAMKIPDSEYFTKEDFILFADPWRGEWDKGVQVPVNTVDDLNRPTVQQLALKDLLTSRSNINHTARNYNPQYDSFLNTTDIKHLFSSFYQPSELRKFNNGTSYMDVYQQYNSDFMDLIWLQIINEIVLHSNINIDLLSKIKDQKVALPYLSFKLFEGIMIELEKSCYTNFKDTYMRDKENTLEFDENVICDVCRSPDSEEGNEMVFCDICNICVHQACYGILKIPKGSWICNPCQAQCDAENDIFKSSSQHPSSSNNPSEYKCCLCPNPGGALKPTPSGNKWCHVSCALWIPEIGIGDPDRMEPITGIGRIPSDRWNFTCAVCKGRRNGACIQCSVKSCRIAFHVTCGFKGGLDMRADWHTDEHSPHKKHHAAAGAGTTTSMISTHSFIPNTHNPDVKLKAFCPKHSRKKPLVSSNSTSTNVGSPLKSDFYNHQNSVLINSAVHSHNSTSNLEESRFQRLKLMEYNFPDFVDPQHEVNKILLPLPSMPFHSPHCFYRTQTNKHLISNTSPKTTIETNSNSKLSGSGVKFDTSKNNKTSYLVSHKATAGKFGTPSKGSSNSLLATKDGKLPHPHSSWIKRVFYLTYNYWKLKRRQRFNAPLVPSIVPLSNVNSSGNIMANPPNLNVNPGKSNLYKTSNPNFLSQHGQNSEFSTSSRFGPLLANTKAGCTSASAFINTMPFDVDNCYSSASIANSLFSEDCFNPINFSSLTQQQLESNLYHRLRMCVQLRQDLERVRNLSYMLVRREKLAGAYVKSRQAVFIKQSELLPRLCSQHTPTVKDLRETLIGPETTADNSLLNAIISLRLAPNSPAFSTSFNELDDQEESLLENSEQNYSRKLKSEDNSFSNNTSNNTPYLLSVNNKGATKHPRQSFISNSGFKTNNPNNFGNARKRLRGGLIPKIGNLARNRVDHIKAKYRNIDNRANNDDNVNRLDNYFHHMDNYSPKENSPTKRSPLNNYSSLVFNDLLQNNNNFNNINDKNNIIKNNNYNNNNKNNVHNINCTNINLRNGYY